MTSQSPSEPQANTVHVREIAILTRKLIETQDALEQEKRAHESTKAQVSEARRTYEEIISSTSWRASAPMRWVSTRLRR